MDLDSVDVRSVRSDDLVEFVRKCNRWSGYGYTKVLYAGNYQDAYFAVMADEHVPLTSHDVSYIHDYHTLGTMSNILYAGNRKLHLAYE